MRGKSIDNALLALRKQVIREGLDGLGHVEALLTLRGVHMPAVMPARRSDVARRGHTALWLMQALRQEPQTTTQLGRALLIAKPDLTHRAARNRAYQGLLKLQARGVVVKEGGVWRLVI